MEITQTPPALSNTTGLTSGDDETARAAISSDFDTFLRMLTVQLQNQDPLNPVDSADYAVQLATFSGVEQQVQTNELLSQLIAGNAASGLAQLAGWVGQEARVKAHGYWDGTPMTIWPDIAAGADGAQLMVRNASGTEVAREAIPLDGEPIVWGGTDSNGAPLPVGSYQFDIVSFEGQTPVSEAPAQVYSKVVEVRSDNGETSIVLQGGKAVPTSDITALREPGA